MDIEDLSEAAEEEHRALNRFCWIEDGWIRFISTDGNLTDIELSRIRHHGDLVKWIRYLAGMSWMTLPVLRHFIQLVCVHHGWDYKPPL